MTGLGIWRQPLGVCVGIVAHESALAGGKRMAIPRFELAI